MKTQTQRDLARRLAAHLGLSQREGTRVTQAVLAVLTEMVLEGGVKLRGFGAFRHSHRREHAHVTPPGTFEVPARVVVAFRAAPALRRREAQ